MCTFYLFIYFFIYILFFSGGGGGGGAIAVRLCGKDCTTDKFLGGCVMACRMQVLQV